MKKPISENDIILYSNGESARVALLETIDGRAWLDSVFGPSQYVDIKELESRAKNLGQSDVVIMVFNSTRSIHLRLNKLSGI